MIFEGNVENLEFLASKVVLFGAAPGQEAFLWEAIKPKLDAKLGAASKEEEQKQQTTYNWTVPEDASSSSSSGTSDEGKKKNKKTGTNNTVND